MWGFCYAEQTRETIKYTSQYALGLIAVSIWTHGFNELHKLGNYFEHSAAICALLCRSRGQWRFSPSSLPAEWLSKMKRRPASMLEIRDGARLFDAIIQQWLMMQMVIIMSLLGPTTPSSVRPTPCQSPARTHTQTPRVTYIGENICSARTRTPTHPQLSHHDDALQ